MSAPRQWWILDVSTPDEPAALVGTFDPETRVLSVGEIRKRRGRWTGRPWQPRRASVPWAFLLVAALLLLWVALLALPLDGWQSVSM